MKTSELHKLQYPIGQFDCPSQISQSNIKDWISILEHFPNRLESLVINLTEKQLEDKMLDTILKNEALKQGKTVVQFLQGIKEESLAQRDTKEE